MNPHNYAHLTFNKDAKNIQQRKDSLASSTNVAGKTGFLPAEN
jgi:hypothetical protein